MDLDLLRSDVPPFHKKEVGKAVAVVVTDQEVADFSPMTHRHDPSTNVDLLVGADETVPFHRQADEFAAILRQQGLWVARTDLSERNHMNSVRDLGIFDSEAGECLTTAIHGSASN